MPPSAVRADSTQEGSGRTPVAWALDFETWARGSAEYAGVDSELRMRLTTLFFFLNRPTVAALMAVGSAMAAAVKDPNVNPGPDPEPGAAPAEKGPPQGTEPAARSGSGTGMPEAADEGGEGAADTSTASPSEAGDAGAARLYISFEGIFRLHSYMQAMQVSFQSAYFIEGVLYDFLHACATLQAQTGRYTL